MAGPGWMAASRLVAGAAGLRLAERYGDWDRRPFDSPGAKHVSVHQRD
jgi:hypothetical protein